MKPIVARLVLAASLFILWLGYLGYLVATRPIRENGAALVVSHPQILTSQIDIIGEITDPKDSVIIKEILYEGSAKLQIGDRIKIGYLDECQPIKRSMKDNPPLDFSGPGEYLIPLHILDNKQYEVADIPSSPGFGNRTYPVRRIYPATAEARAQYAAIRKPTGE